jgi:hypothetical protein
MGWLTDEQAFFAAEDQWAFCLFVRPVVNVCRAVVLVLHVHLVRC